MPDPQPDRAPLPAEPTSVGGIFWAVLILVAAAAATAFSTQPPPLDPDRDEGAFSAERALDELATLLGEELPHPVGSEEHAAVRDRLQDALGRLGLEPTVQDTVARGPGGSYARVRNVLARLPGEQPGPAILLSAHYDSVAAGPGASDDGLGVACVLEIARALTSTPPVGRDVILLFSDGEELGLVGAAAFASEHPWFEDVGVALNLEMRGAGGRSLLFETGDDSGQLIARFGRDATRPATNSLAAEVYRRMPNDTDFTVYRRAGLPGANLAAIGDVAAYHRPLDRIERIDPRTLQHQGDQALTLVRGLAEGPLPVDGDGGRVYADLFGLALLGWPESGSLLLSALAVVLTLLTLRRLRKREALRTAQVVWGVAGLLLTLILSAVACVGLRVALTALTGSERFDYADASPVLAGYVLCALVATLVATALTRRAGFWGFWCAALILGSLGSVASTLVAPGVSFFPLVPTLVGGLLPHVSTAMRSPFEARSREIAFSLTLVASAILWVPITREIQLALGSANAPVLGVLLGLFGLLLAPLLGAAGGALRLALGTALVAGLAGTVLWARTAPPYDAEHPQTLNLLYVADGDSDEARFQWWTPRDPVPELARTALGDDVTESELWDWTPRPMLVPTPDQDEEPPTGPVAAGPAWGALAPVVQVSEEESEDGERRLRARLRSLRFAEGLHLCLPESARIESVRIGERTFDEASLREEQAQWDDDIESQISFWGLEDAPVEVRWTQEDDGQGFVVFDSSSRMPPAADEILASRPAEASPAYTGDLSLLYRQITP